MGNSNSRVTELFGHIERLEEHFSFRQRKCTELCADLGLQEIRAIYLVGKKTGINMRDLASGMRLAVNSLTVLVDKLVRKKYLHRVRPPEDRRVVQVFLTRKGTRVYDATTGVFLEMSRKMLSALDRSEQDDLLRLLRLIGRSGAGKQ